ncbi:MAG: secretin [Limnochordia bacterium]|jgi:type II secretory pathway component GspD/PulD (secretin)
MRFIGALLVIAILAAPVLAEPLVSTLFFETDIREALGELVLQTGINIITDETVKGTVTLDLVDVPFEKALRMILLGGGFSFRKIEDYYLVGLPDPRGPAFHHLAETATVRLQYMRADEAMSLLPSIYGSYVKSGRERDLLTITAPSSIIERFKADIKEIDRPQQQILIQALVTEVSSEVLEQWGSGLFEFTVNKGEEVNPDWETTLGFEDGIISLTTDVFGELEAALEILKGQEKAEIRANPRMVVADRASANLFIGERRHLILESDEYKRLEQVDVGVTLKVTPRILSDEVIQLTIAPEISHFVDKNGKDDTLIVRRSEVATTVYVQNGQTLVLAGMTLDEQGQLERKVPILGDIPLIRWFFRRATEREGERELLIFITPEIK